MYGEYVVNSYSVEPTPFGIYGILILRPAWVVWLYGGVAG